jgi:phosphoribosylformylglycinamidine cyclo-ligase
MSSVKRQIARIARSTYNNQVLSEIGLFGALFRVPQMHDGVLVASCDGVGTKLVVAHMMRRYDTVGIDIVNHSVNDILTLGARPLFFLDYISHSDLGTKALVQIAEGLAKACRDNGCALVGGETAMLPDVYKSGEFDLVGFIVGFVEQNMIPKTHRLSNGDNLLACEWEPQLNIEFERVRVTPGDVAIGIPSRGLHTNGYSLARKVLFGKAGYTVRTRIKGLRLPLGEELLRPHRSYLKDVYPLLEQQQPQPLLTAIAHITGGGFEDNIKRLLPRETSVLIWKKGWRPPRIFTLIQELGNIPDDEMYRVFNMGMGMVLFVSPKKSHIVLNAIRGSQPIGKVVRGTFGVSVV